MVLKGILTSFEQGKPRVVFIDKEKIVSPPLNVAAHVTGLNINDNVAVIFFSNSMVDGLIIGRW